MGKDVGKYNWVWLQSLIEYLLESLTVFLKNYLAKSLILKVLPAWDLK